jgi:hypothetical protein
MSKLTPKLTYANVAATLALVFSMSGGALAAGHYLINSKNQVNPKVLKALKWARGSKGAAGAAGPGGPTGAVGATGPIGAEGRRGQPGLNGDTGLQGETGEPGAAGSTGAQGVTGPNGATGEKGSEGKPGAEGNQGVTGEPGATGEKGDTGPTGATGESGAALAYAHVSKKGALSKSKNVGKVEEAGSGIFCLSGIAGTLHTVEATIDDEEAESFELSIVRATLGRGGETCPEGTNVTVETSVALLEEGVLEEEEVAQGFFVTVN